MSSVRVSISVDTSQVDRDLIRVGDGPDKRHHLQFSQVLDRQFLEISALIHVVTGSLKDSGRVGGRARREGGWEGQIVWPGVGAADLDPVPGPPRDPSRYAEYEYNKAGNHDWLRNSYNGDPGYVDVIKDFLRGTP